MKQHEERADTEDPRLKAAETLASVLQMLLDDLKDRAKWMVFEPSSDGSVLPCGNGVYLAAEYALKAYKYAVGTT